VAYQSSILQYFHTKLPGREALLGQFLRYFVTGGLAFFVDFGLFALFLYGCGLYYLLANLIGLVGGLIVNYLISVGWVFTACKRTLDRRRGVEFLIFSIIGVIGVALNQGLMWLMVDRFSLHPMLSKIIAAAIVLLWNFGGRKVLLFRGKRETV